jgi:hypothetical protein
MFLKNREFRIKVVKTPKNEEDSTEMDETMHVDPEQIEEISRRIVRHIAVAITGVILVWKVADTLSEIAINKSKSKDEE